MIEDFNVVIEVCLIFMIDTFNVIIYGLSNFNIKSSLWNL